MMRSYIQKATAWKNKVYQEVLRECGDRIAKSGYFRKDAVIQKLGYDGMEDVLNWSFIVDWLSDTNGAYGVMTVPVAERFFKEKVYARSPTATGPIAIGRYIATGNGKKTVGYVRASFQGGEFLLWRAQHMLAQHNGKKEALKAIVTRANSDPAISPTVMKALPIV